MVSVLETISDTFDGRMRLFAKQFENCTENIIRKKDPFGQYTGGFTVSTLQIYAMLLNANIPWFQRKLP